MIVREIAAGIGYAVRLARWIRAHWGEIKLLVQSYLWYRNRRVRVSMAYLFRIKVGDEYMLIRGNRIPDQYQPVGGVYKYFAGAKSVLDSFGAVGDVFVRHDEDSKDDLRRVLQRGVKLHAFLRWFHSGQNRECDPRREFHDEVIATGILDADLFSRVDTQWVRSVGIGIRYSPELEIPEYLFADVFEILLSDEQEAALRALRDVRSDQYRFVDEQCIRSYGQTCGLRIGSHTWKILEGAVEPPRRS
ncbi:MAG TPA: hypothetical protein VMX15_06600 [Candidatus Heimdallarchaeota archaeon]|nr:hypothetical protein [Candidatus Heimdallarchaeota archaeon]